MYKGFRHTEESKQKMRLASLGRVPTNKGIKLSPEEVLRNTLKIREYYKTHAGANKGKVFSAEYRKKLSDAHKGQRTWLGKHHSEETKRKISAAKKGQRPSVATEFKRGEHTGGKNVNWKGGITPLNKWIRRSSVYKDWVKRVFARDDYTCQICGRRGCTLEAHHHIKSFYEMLQEFLRMYSQFSVFEDRETLVRLSESYAPFWDINFGKTLCVDCHNETKAGRKCAVEHKTY